MATEAATEAPTLAQFDDAKPEKLLQLARITEQAERFEDMCTIMGNLVKKKHEAQTPLKVEERNMLSVAYKNVVGQRRASWRTLKAEEEQGDGEQPMASYRTHYKKVVEAELSKKCLEVLNLLQDHLIDPKAAKEAVESTAADAETIVETQVFYLKMSGDYYRYLAEFSQEEEHKNAAGDKYSQALELAKARLQPTHPTRLGLALNASVCYYEIMKQPKKACELAKDAFDKAIQKLDSLSDSTYKDSTLIMQLLRDNLTIWTSENDGVSNNATIEDNED